MKKNKLLLPILAAVLALVVIAGVILVPRLPKDEVAVFPVSMVGYTDFYSGSSESYGMVTTDKVQTLYLSGTQTVTEILVYPGQSVKKGDVLFTYDTTLSDLAIERKDLANQQLEVELKAARAELASLKKMKPIQYKPGSSASTTKTDYTKSPTDKSKLDTVYSTKTSGTSAYNPLYVWLSTTTRVDEAMIEYLFSQATNPRDTVYVVFQTTTGNQPGKEFNTHTGVSFRRLTVTPPTVPTEPPVETTDPTETTAPEQPSDPSTPTETTAPTEEPSEPVEEPADPVIAIGGSSTSPSGTVTYSMGFFTPPSAPKEDNGTVQWNDGYTSAELTAMKNEKQAEINQLQFDIKMGKAELKIMQKEATDGKVVAEWNGVVSDILEPAQALETGEPLMKVTGGGGYYVEGTVSELALNTIEVGQSVTVNSWDTGAVYTGRIVEIGEYPTEDQGYSYDSTNASFYPYKVFIDQQADLQDGYYVSMTYQTPEQAAGILYLQNAFLRTEGNRTYVLVRNADGVLEKRYLECGVSTDGYMTPIHAGITEEDFLAFPYGSEAVEGAPTFEGTDQDLYGY